VDSPAVAAQGRALTRRLAQEPGATQVTSYWTGQAAPLRSRDGRQALVLARITGDDSTLGERTDELVARYEHDGTATRVQAGGQLRVYREVNTQVESDLAKAEGIAVPITLLLLLVVVFASAVAALLPLAVGGFAIVGTLLILRVLAGLTDVSVYALNLTTALGLGLAVDYSLLSSRATASSCAPAASRPTPWRSPCRPPAAPCCSAPSPSPRRCWR
jgi:putative drug exporter of the RND superfamily